MVKDPVCGMEVRQEDAFGRAEYEGKTYHFCSESCLKAFQADPAKYVGKQ